MRILTIVLLIVFSSYSQAYRPIDKVVNIFNECQWNSEVSSIKADCNDLFHHYLPAEDEYKPGKEVRLGSYNIFRLSEQKFKRLDLTAEMMNKSWDIVAVSEVQPNRADQLQLNVNALIAAKKGKITKKKLVQVYAKPRYLLLLEELQKRDKSWGFVVSPFSQGLDSELFGFYYRANRAQIIESNYCKEKYSDYLSGSKKLHVYREQRFTDDPGDSGVSATGGTEAYDRKFVAPKKALACTLAVEGLGLKRFSKIPLTARFKSGKFDFSYITLHLRFRADDTVLNKCKEKCKATAAEMLKDINLTSSQFKKIAGNSQGSEISNGDAQEIARFFEAITAVREAVKIKKAESDKDVIVAGDYNLDYEPDGKWSVLWEALLKVQKDSEVLIESKTSVSNKEGLSNNYDHFVLVSKAGHTDECDVSSAQSLNFLDPEFIFADELSYYLNASNFESIVEDFRKDLLKKEVVTEKLELLTYEDITKMDRIPSEFKKKYKICRIDNDYYDTDCSKPLGIEGQVRRTDDSLEICEQGRWLDQSEVEDNLQKAKVPAMAQATLNPVDGKVNNLLCQILYQNADLPKELLVKLHPRHKTRINFDGKPLANGDIPKPEIYKPYTTLMSDHVPIGMNCSTEKGD